MKEKTKKKPEITKLIEEEYMIHLEEDTDELYWTKEAIKKVLTPLERKIYITYLEEGSYAGGARTFSVCTQTFKTYINKLTARIREYVCEHLN